MLFEERKFGLVSTAGLLHNYVRDVHLRVGAGCAGHLLVVGVHSVGVTVQDRRLGHALNRVGSRRQLASQRVKRVQHTRQGATTKLTSYHLCTGRLRSRDKITTPVVTGSHHTIMAPCKQQPHSPPRPLLHRTITGSRCAASSSCWATASSTPEHRLVPDPVRKLSYFIFGQQQNTQLIYNIYAAKKG